jgi:hypothetical protein
VVASGGEKRKKWSLTEAAEDTEKIPSGFMDQTSIIPSFGIIKTAMDRYNARFGFNGTSTKSLCEL